MTSMTTHVRFSSAKNIGSRTGHRQEWWDDFAKIVEYDRLKTQNGWYEAVWAGNFDFKARTETTKDKWQSRRVWSSLGIWWSKKGFGIGAASSLYTTNVDEAS